MFGCWRLLRSLISWHRNKLRMRWRFENKPNTDDLPIVSLLELTCSSCFIHSADFGSSGNNSTSFIAHNAPVSLQLKNNSGFNKKGALLGPNNYRKEWEYKQITCYWRHKHFQMYHDLLASLSSTANSSGTNPVWEDPAGTKQEKQQLTKRDKQLQEGEAKDEHSSYVHWQHQWTFSDATARKHYPLLQPNAQAIVSSATVKLACSVADFWSVYADFEAAGCWLESCLC